MRDALVVMNARNIEPCMAAFRQLPIDKIWLRGFTENEIQRVWPGVLAMQYDWLWLVSDDVIVREPALAAVRGLASEEHPVVTGYSQRSHDNWVVNLTSEPLRGSLPAEESYTFMRYQDVVSHPTPVVPTWFTGMSLTGMSREMWTRYPFQCYDDGRWGYGSDFNISSRLQGDNVPIVAAREGFAYHWRVDHVFSIGSVDENPDHTAKSIAIEEYHPLGRVYNKTGTADVRRVAQ